MLSRHTSTAADTAPLQLRGLLDEAIGCYTDEDYDRAYQLLTEVRAAIEQGVPALDRDADTAMRYLARTLLALGAADDAHALLVGHLADLDTRCRPDDLETALSTVTFADVLRHLGHLGRRSSPVHAGDPARLESAANLEAAERWYRHVTDLDVNDQDDTWWAVLLAEAGLALTTAARGHPHPAARQLDRVLHAAEDAYGLDHPAVLRIAEDLLTLHLALGDTAAAHALLTTVGPIAADALGTAHPLTARLTAHVADLHPTAPAGAHGPHSRAQAGQPRRGHPSPARRATLGGGRQVRSSPGPRGSGQARTALLVVLFFAAAVLLGVAVGVVVYQLAVRGHHNASTAPTPNPPAGSVSETSRPSGAGYRSAFPPPVGVHVEAVTATTITMRWSDPTTGTRPSIVSISAGTGPLRFAATLQAAVTSYRAPGLAPGTGHCLVVAVAYAPTVTAAAPSICATTLPAQTHAGAPHSAVLTSARAPTGPARQCRDGRGRPCRPDPRMTADIARSAQHSSQLRTAQRPALLRTPFRRPGTPPNPEPGRSPCRRRAASPASLSGRLRLAERGRSGANRTNDWRRHCDA